MSASWSAGPFNVLHDCGSADLEFSSQCIDLGASAVAIEQTVDFLRVQAILDLVRSERSGSSSG
jgi:hypothetical protein